MTHVFNKTLHRHLKSSVTIIVSPFPPTMCLDIITDKHWFTENILCLLSNAVKYSNGGVVTVAVEYVPAERVLSPDDKDTDSSSSSEISGKEGSTIKISVEDSGIGISEDARLLLFQPFKQVQRLAGGTGLGLYSLSNRISELKGSRGVSSRVDGMQGSRFWFTIPYRPDPHFIPESREICQTFNSIMHPSSSSSSIELLSGKTTACPSTDNSIVLEGIRFLVVDDSTSIARVVSRALTTRKHSVETENNGSAGLDRLIEGYATNDFDVVLMDLQMPIMDGIETVRRYRIFESDRRREASLNGSTDDLHDPPRRLFIIGMSANSDGATKQCALDVGMDAFLPKPFTMADLQSLIGHLHPAKLSLDGNYLVPKG